MRNVLFTAVIGLISGFAGSYLHYPRSVQSFRGEVIRAHTFELLDSNSGRVGSWTVDNDGTAQLVIAPGRERASIAVGVRRDGTPFLHIADTAARIRAALQTNADGSATLFFNEVNREGAMRVGSILGDAPNPENRTNGVVVSTGDSARAEFLVQSRRRGVTTAGIYLRDSKGETWLGEASSRR